jgi:transposase-like protein
MGAVDEPIKPVKWTKLSGEERYRVVEMARRGELEVSQVCQAFGVSRTTLYRAMEEVDRVAIEALEPKKRGRKPTPVPEVRAAELASTNASLEKELAHWKTKYEVARSFIELERKLLPEASSPGPQEKKRLRNRRKRERRAAAK